MSDKPSQPPQGGRRQTTVGIYPHDMHPGLVPGIPVEEQRNRFAVDKIIFSVTAVLIVSFIMWGVWRPDQVS